MVKADLSRDYYGDLGISPSADAQEIKRQFKKLALTFHPDRNPGRESEVTAQFQKIQSAHEVLLDLTERAKYDANKRTTSRYSAYTGPSASGMKGNPWSDAGSQWAPPPKGPTARKPGPPPSAGARRYDKFDAPKTPQWQANEGAEARTKNYEAWENMRPHGPSSSRPASANRPGPGRTWAAPKVPPRENPQSGRNASNSKTHVPPPRARPGFPEYRQNQTSDTSPRRTESMNGRKGFMPNTPGGDEPAAPKGAYFTTQRAAPEPPPVPPRNPSPVAPRPSMNGGPDPLRQFRDQASKSNYEPRTSTPYSTHGGEKFNPFESANIGRSKSTREPEHTNTKHVPRTGSDPNLGSPQRSSSFAGHQTRPRKPAPTVQIDSDSDTSSNEGPKLHGGAFGRRRMSKNMKNGTGPASRAQQMPNVAEASSNSSKPVTNMAKFRQWMKENPGQEPPLNGFPPDGPPLRQDPTKNEIPDGSKMYASHANSFSSSPDCKSSYAAKYPTYSDLKTANAEAGILDSDSAFAQTWRNLFPRGAEPANSPSGGSGDPRNLTTLEAIQRDVIDKLITGMQSNSGSQPRLSTPEKRDLPGTESVATYGATLRSSSQWHDYRDSVETSPAKKLKPINHMHSVHVDSMEKARSFWPDHGRKKSKANHFIPPNRFSFPVHDDTFTQTQPAPNGFASPSEENISTRFTPEDWAGKFEAGADYFKPEQNAAAPATSPQNRSKSTSRSRGRSPIKIRSMDPKLVQPLNARGEREVVMESPGGTKFSPEEWAQHFKPQTFAPPAFPSRPAGKKARASVVRPTMGTAAVVDDGEAGDEKPLFGKPSMSTTPRSAPVPEPMDVDTPPAAHTVPKFAEAVNTNASTKRPAAPSQSQSPVDAESLKVNFDDLNIRDLVSSLGLPSLPKAPNAPPPPTMSESISAAAAEKYKKEFEIYMRDWDLFNSKIMLHLVARKNQVDGYGSKRWENDQVLELYRHGLREDALVGKHWQEARESHEKVMKEYMVIKERMKSREETERILNGESTSARQRNEAH